MPERPRRLRLPDFDGRLISLADGPETWRQIKAGGEAILLLGLGPGEWRKLPFLEPGKPVFYLESPQTEAALAKAGIHAPAHWQRLEPAQALARASGCEVWHYKPGLQLAPLFWGPILARLEAARFAKRKAAPKTAWLPGNDGQLLHRDLIGALRRHGYESISEAAPIDAGADQAPLWGGDLPDLAISVNFRGLDSDGRLFWLCKELGIPLAVWLVDNPWNLLSGISLPWWREASIFVTDPSFLAPLRENGAKRVEFLPLAASHAMLAQGEQGQPEPLSGPVFVGTSQFAAKSRYFAGLRIEPGLLGRARELAAHEAWPDFHWWQSQIDAKLWPGKEARQAAFGCDEFSGLRRAAWLRGAAQNGLKIYGDGGWRQALGADAVLAPVDYYAQLPRIYAGSECVLNVTSLLLPRSLNQRHFDVWAAGGFLLTDAAPGLELFPQELAAPISLKSPREFGAKLAWLRANPSARRELQVAWRQLIAEKHTYEGRVERMLAALGA